MKRHELNLRDLGGIPFANGKGTVPHGLYLRSGKLSILTKEECANLCKEYRIACVIDLRTSVESAEYPDPLSGNVEYLQIPLLKDSTIGITHETGSDPMIVVRNLRKHPEKLKEMIAAQGGDPAVCDDVTLLPQAAVIRRVACGTAGYVQGMNTVALGSAAQEMGAGRKKLGDALDYSVGFVLPVRIGDRVEPETELCTLYARNEEEAQRAEAAVRAAVRIGPEACGKPPVFFAKVTKDGIKDLRNA